MRIGFLLLLTLFFFPLSAQDWLKLEPTVGSDSLRAALGVEMMNVYISLPGLGAGEEEAGHVVRIVKHAEREVEYNDAGQPELVRLYNADNGKLNKTIRYWYNVKGQRNGRTEDAYTSIFTGDGTEQVSTFQTKARFKYNERGLLVEEVPVDDKSLPPIPDYRISYDWDDQGRLIWVERVYNYPTYMEFAQMYEHKGDTTWVLANKDRKVDSWLIVVWDDQGRIQEKITNKDDLPQFRQTYEYRKGRLYKAIYWKWRSDQWEQYNEEELFYNRQGLLVMRRYTGGEMDGREDIYEYFFTSDSEK